MCEEGVVEKYAYLYCPKCKAKHLRAGKCVCGHIRLNHQYEAGLKIHPNQIKCADEIVTLLKTKHMILVLGKLQGGKTGVMIGLIWRYLEVNVIPPDNIYIITALSSTDWINQTQSRLKNTGINDNNIYHRNKLKDLSDKIKNKKNVLILIDEIQIANQNNMTLDNMFETLELKEPSKLIENNINIIMFSATPNGVVGDLKQYKDVFDVVELDTGDGYHGLSDMLKNGQIYNAEDLRCFNKKKGKKGKNVVCPIQVKEKIGYLKTLLLERERVEVHPLYIIIRVHTKNKEDESTKQNIVSIFGETVNYICYDQNYKKTHKNDEDKGDLNKILEIVPLKNTFIFIKEMLRCAQTLKKQNIAFVYDRPVEKPNDSVMCQSLPGRCGGYDHNKNIIIFTNVKSIEKYCNIWKNGGKNGWMEIVKATWSEINPSFLNLEGNGVSGKTKSKEYGERVYDDFEKLKEERKKLTKITTRSPQKKLNSEFYEATINGERKIWSKTDIEKNPYIGQGNNKGGWVYPYYIDLKKAETLQWIWVWDGLVNTK